MSGHSVGALLAFETARRLQRLGHRPPELLALSGLAAPHLGTYRTAMPQLLLAGREGIAEPSWVGSRVGSELGGAAVFPNSPDNRRWIVHRHASPGTVIIQLDRQSIQV
ncbi:thioesterase domain-containing protein [Kitasatospora sp. NPDC059803]|uniref:thioesterase domain-containing protein n=1 Tax=Kitasatospora sp. NPDC059803 TaxID=3346953 RepID=UPI00365BE2AD